MSEHKPMKYEYNLPFTNRSELEDNQYVIFEKRSRSHLLASIISSECNVGFGIYSLAEDGTLKKYLAFPATNKVCTRYLEVAKGEYIFVFFTEDGREILDPDDIEFCVYEEDILESIQRRARTSKKNISQLKGKTQNFIHNVFQRQN